MNTELSKKVSLNALIVKFNLSVVGTIEGWKFLDVTNKFTEVSFNSLTEADKWAKKYLQKLEDDRLLAEGKSKAGGLQMDFF